MSVAARTAGCTSAGCSRSASAAHAAAGKPGVVFLNTPGQRRRPAHHGLEERGYLHHVVDRLDDDALAAGDAGKVSNCQKVQRLRPSNVHRNGRAAHQDEGGFVLDYKAAVSDAMHSGLREAIPAL